MKVTKIPFLKGGLGTVTTGVVLGLEVIKIRGRVETIQTTTLLRSARIRTLEWGCPRGVMVKAMDCGILVREFVLQSRYCVNFRTNTLGKGMNPLILPTMG